MCRVVILLYSLIFQSKLITDFCAHAPSFETILLVIVIYLNLDYFLGAFKGEFHILSY